MENKELWEHKYKVNYDNAKNFVAQGNLSDAKEAFKRALEAAIKLAEMNKGSKLYDKYKSDAEGVSDLIKMINTKLDVAAQEKPKTKSKEEPISKVKVEEPEKVTVEQALSELNGLEGLRKVKQQVANFVDQLSVFELRRRNKLPVPLTSYHLVFIGNAGSGKTTVARIMAKIYRALGIVSKGQLVEVKRNDLVAGFVGQTAIKTQEVIDKAMGGVLFIDEAYMLYKKEGNDFGQEAIDTLMKAMEDSRDDFIVIVAGYDKEMNEFLDSNPGLLGRFKTVIEFTDYNSVEMYNIFEKMCSSNKYVIADGVKEKLMPHFDYVYEHRTRKTGNARYVRNLFENTIQKQASRLMKNVKGIGMEQLVVILPEDLAIPQSVSFEE